MKITNKEEIKNWLNKHGITNYIINPNGVVDVYGSVHLSMQGLEYIPIQFGVVDGDFIISFNKLKSLKGSPLWCNNFNCSHNMLTSLEYAPEEVKNIFCCSNNLLKSLDFAPRMSREIITILKNANSYCLLQYNYAKM